jgi:hypothetical protein
MSLTFTLVMSKQQASLCPSISTHVQHWIRLGSFLTGYEWLESSTSGCPFSLPNLHRLNKVHPPLPASPLARWQVQLPLPPLRSCSHPSQQQRRPDHHQLHPRSSVPHCERITSQQVQQQQLQQ